MTTIEVSEITPPAYGKKKSKVTTTNGDIYYIWPDKAGLLTPGGRVEVEWEESTFRGKTYKTITAARYPGPHANANGHTVPSSDAPTSAPSEQEFVTTLLAAYITSRQINPGDKDLLWKTTKMLRGLWGVSFGTNKSSATEH